MNEGEKVKKTRAKKSTKATVSAAAAEPVAPTKVKAPAKPRAKKAKVAETKTTTVVAKVDIGFGNALFLRGTGPGLSWEKGVAMTNTGSDEWIWSTTAASEAFLVKALINDEIWAIGEDIAVKPGSNTISPEF